MEKFFKFKEHNTNLKIETTAGATTFMTMAAGGPCPDFIST